MFYWIKQHAAALFMVFLVSLPTCFHPPSPTTSTRYVEFEDVSLLLPSSGIEQMSVILLQRILFCLCMWQLRELLLVL